MSGSATASSRKTSETLQQRSFRDAHVSMITVAKFQRLLDRFLCLYPSIDGGVVILFWGCPSVCACMRKCVVYAFVPGRNQSPVSLPSTSSLVFAHYFFQSVFVCSAIHVLFLITEYNNRKIKV